MGGQFYSHSDSYETFSSVRYGRTVFDTVYTINRIFCQCPKLRFYLVRPQGALLLKLCTREVLHAPSLYVSIIIGLKNVHTPGAHL